jgi:redox-sensitive bicupin YhaK (pirin superfamily)
MARILLQCQDRRVTIDVRRAADRFVTRAEGRATWHSFSFDAHYDPDNVGFGSLVALNDEHLPPGSGYPDHPHRDTEIVTVVLSGALRHSDSSGRSGVLVPGEISRTSAGSGIVHAEVAASDETTRFVQTWLRPDEPGGPSSYVSAEVGRPGRLTEVVGPDGATSIATRAARLLLGHLETGPVELPDAPQLHVFSTGAVVTVGGQELRPGSAARLTDEGGCTLTVTQPGLLLVWSLAR